MNSSNSLRAMSPSNGLKLDSKGATLIEVMIVIGIIAFVMSIITMFAYVGMTAWRNQNARVKLESQAQSCMYALTYNLRQAQPGTVSISNLPGEMNESMISFKLVGASTPVTFAMVTNKGSRSVVLMPSQVLATDVLSFYFTFPAIGDTSRVLVNLSLYKVPLVGKAPVAVQSQEIVYIRN